MKRPSRAVVVAFAVGGVLGGAAMVLPVQFVLATGSNEFCGTGCHSMTPALESYERGPHARNASGVPATCSDCHIPYESQHANAVEFAQLLWFKALAGGKDAIAELRGTIATPERWKEEQPRLREKVRTFIASTHAMTCRGCHQLETFAGAANPMAAQVHAGEIRPETVNCLECHSDFAHVEPPAPAGPKPPTTAPSTGG